MPSAVPLPEERFALLKVSISKLQPPAGNAQLQLLQNQLEASCKEISDVLGRNERLCKQLYQKLESSLTYDHFFAATVNKKEEKLAASPLTVTQITEAYERKKACLDMLRPYIARWQKACMAIDKTRKEHQWSDQQFFNVQQFLILQKVKLYRHNAYLWQAFHAVNQALASQEEKSAAIRQDGPIARSRSTRELVATYQTLHKEAQQILAAAHEATRAISQATERWQKEIKPQVNKEGMLSPSEEFWRQTLAEGEKALKVQDESIFFNQMSHGEALEIAALPYQKICELYADREEMIYQEILKQRLPGEVPLYLKDLQEVVSSITSLRLTALANHHTENATQKQQVSTMRPAVASMVDPSKEAQTENKNQESDSLIAVVDLVKAQITAVLDQSLENFLKRHQVKVVDGLAKKDQKRYAVIVALKDDITVTANKTKEQIQSANATGQSIAAAAIEKGYYEALATTIAEHLAKKELEKYSFFAKLALALLNLLALFSGAVLVKKAKTHTWFFSLEGKPKEAVKAVSSLVRRYKNMKP